MVSVFASSAVDRGFVPDGVKPKTIKLVFCFSTKHVALRRKTGWLRIKIMCQSWATCISVDCCFSEHYKNPTKRVSAKQTYYYLIEN